MIEGNSRNQQSQKFPIQKHFNTRKIVPRYPSHLICICLKGYCKYTLNHCKAGSLTSNNIPKKPKKKLSFQLAIMQTLKASLSVPLKPMEDQYCELTNTISYFQYHLPTDLSVLLSPINSYSLPEVLSFFQTEKKHCPRYLKIHAAM